MSQICFLCVGEPEGCLRCGGTGTDPDPDAPVVAGSAVAGAS